MAKKMQLYRKIIATLHDGKEIRISVYKSGQTIELRFINPYNGFPDSILVRPIHAGTPEGWMYDIGNQRGINMSIVNWRCEN